MPDPVDIPPIASAVHGSADAHGCVVPKASASADGRHTAILNATADAAGVSVTRSRRRPRIRYASVPALAEAQQNEAHATGRNGTQRLQVHPLTRLLDVLRRPLTKQGRPAGGRVAPAGDARRTGWSMAAWRRRQTEKREITTIEGVAARPDRLIGAEAFIALAERSAGSVRRA